MRILLVSDYGTLVGGAEAGLLTLRDGLRERGHDARVFSSSARPGGARFADYECLGTTSSLRTLLQTANPWAAAALRRVLREFRPDVVHVTMFLTQLSPLIQPLLRDVPSLYHVVWYRPVCPLGTKLLPDGRACEEPAGRVCWRNDCLPTRDWAPLMVQMRLWRRWRDCFDIIVANSEATMRQLIQAGIEPVEVVLNGIPIRPAGAPLVDPPTVAFAGRLVPEKGVDVLLRAFAAAAAELPAARLVIAGDGGERARLEALATSLDLGERVSFVGYLPPGELEHLLERAWVQAVPSLWAEPFGIVAIEALMRGRAVVASGAGGPAEIVRPGETGLLVRSGDVQALAGALLTVLSDRALAETLGGRGREDALARFEENRYVTDFVRLYERLTAPGTASR